VGCSVQHKGTKLEKRAVIDGIHKLDPEIHAPISIIRRKTCAGGKMVKNKNMRLITQMG